MNSGSSKNTDSLVLMIEDFRAIFPGDAVGITEEFADANFRGAVQASGLSASHHRGESHGSNSVKWAAATSPEVIIYSSGRLRGHPRCSVTRRYKASLAAAPGHEMHCNMDIDFGRRQVTHTGLAEYVTDGGGSIVITSNGRSPMILSCDFSEIPH